MKNFNTLPNNIHNYITSCYYVCPICVKDILLSQKSKNIIGWSINFEITGYEI